MPTRTRNHDGYVLLWDGEGHLFDPGEGTQRQMILAGVSAAQVTRICLTHVHGDHCFGLPGVLSRMVLDGVKHPVHLHYPASGNDVVRALVSLASPGLDLRLRPHAGPGPIATGVEVQLLNHRVETYGYRLVEPDGRTLLPERLTAAGITGADVGRLQREGSLGNVSLEDVSVARPGQRFAFVMDTALCEGAEELADGADLLVPSVRSTTTTPPWPPSTVISPPGRREHWPPSAALGLSSSRTSRRATWMFHSWPSKQERGRMGPWLWQPMTSTGSRFPNGGRRSENVRSWRARKGAHAPRWRRSAHPRLKCSTSPLPEHCSRRPPELLISPCPPSRLVAPHAP